MPLKFLKIIIVMKIESNIKKLCDLKNNKNKNIKKIKILFGCLKKHK